MCVRKVYLELLMIEFLSHGEDIHSSQLFLKMGPIMELYLSRSENAMEASLDMKTLAFMTSEKSTHCYSRENGQVKHQP